MKNWPQLRTAIERGVPWGWLAMSACLLWTSPVVALTPESPEVKAAVSKGLAYLMSGPANDEKRIGAEALMGMAFAKTDAPLNHPRIQQAVKSIREGLASQDGDFNNSVQIYSIGLSLVFLASTDGKAYRTEIDQLLSKLLTAQQAGGGWGYPNSQDGDTSMTQYGVLGLWESYRIGSNPPLQSWERVANWLLRTQDPSGAYGYTGIDPGGGNLVPQNEIRPSMSAAGLGSVYVCLDHFGGDKKTLEDGPKLPPGLKPVKKADTRGKQRPNNVDLNRMRNAAAMGNRWFETKFTTDPEEWDHYYYYAFERYRSFRETVENSNDKEPKWYTDIATHLIKTQGADGSWTDEAGTVPDTAFSILFLVRSTKKSIQKALGEGTLVGGRGLPTDANNVEMRLGNVMRKPLTGPADKLLSLMENPTDPNFLSAVEGFAQKNLEPDDAQLPQHLVRLRKLAGGDSPAARAVALRALSKTRDLDLVPLLIYALRDPDWGVVKEARDGLRFVSRKFESLGPELPYEGVDVDKLESDRRKAIEAWKAWYRSIRPDYEFND